MSKRTDYQRDYMRSYRAKQREAGATALHAKPTTESSGTGFTDRQLGQLREVIREELATLLTPPTISLANKAQATALTAVDVNRVNTPQGKLTMLTVNTVNQPIQERLTTATVNPVSKPCPQCGGDVTRKPTAVYCSDQCRYAALAKRRKAARQLAKQGRGGTG